MNLFLSLVLLNSFAFFSYGISCLFSKKMVEEFIRFGLSNQQRLITGIAQLAGAAGLLIGYYYLHWMGLLAAIGLCVLMLMGFLVRVKIKDSLSKSFPSFFFMLLNLILAYSFYQEFKL